MKDKTSGELQAELDEIINWFGSDEADIDTAEERYSAALEIIKELTTRLSNTKNSITKLQHKFDEPK